MPLKSLGRQLMVEYYDCSPALLNDLKYITNCMLRAAQVSGATVIKEFFHPFNPHGISGVVVIAESHLAIHTWPEYGYAAVDLFTCGEEVDPYKGFDYLRCALGAKHSTVQEIERGRLDPSVANLRHKPIAEAS